MNKYKFKFKSVRKVIFTALLALLVGCVFLGYSIFGTKEADANSSVPSSTDVGALFDYDSYSYDESNLNELARRVLNAVRGTPSSATFDDMITYAKNTAGTRGTAIPGNTSITVSYGRYRFTTSASSSYKQLAWMPVYLSTSNRGDAILTLYLCATSDSNGTTTEQEIGNFSHDATYSSSVSHNYPSNMYGSSFIRASLLGNNGTYASYKSANDTSDYVRLWEAKVNESNCNKFNDFIKYYQVEDPDKTTGIILGRAEGLLYEDIAVPAEMEWQSDQSAMYWLQDTEYGSYAMPNEAYGLPNNNKQSLSGKYPSPVTDPVRYYSTHFDYAAQDKKFYDEWKNDKVWLPSLSEVGTGTIEVGTGGNADVDTTNGIWKLSYSKKSNTPGVKSWLRTANVTAPKTGDYSTYTMYGLDSDGKVCNIDVNEQAGIRPAIHLNLSKIKSGNKTVPPIVLPRIVYSDYVGDFQTMAVIPEDQKTWYSAEDMTVDFYFDEECTKGTRPVNAGKYYMMVQLRSGSRRKFFGGDQTKGYRVVPFVVRKAPIYVKWTYEDITQLNSPPIKVEIDTDVSTFYERDEHAGNVPEIGMLYSDETGAGLQNWPTYPDKIGYYYARAYIIEEDIHNYNYELIESDDHPLGSHLFYVDRKEIDLPYFLENGDTTIDDNYKGKRYVQIANADPKYIRVTISVDAASDTAKEEAEKRIVDHGAKFNTQHQTWVHTFEVESVAGYDFVVELVDPDNTVWAESGIDVSPKTLRLNIERAEITVSFKGLPTTWGAAAEVQFTLEVVGIYNSEDAKNISFTVTYWEGFKSTDVPYDSGLGKYVFRANTLAMGDYYIYAVMSDNLGYTSNYQMSTPVTQKFTVVQTISTFTPALVKWQYRLNGTESASSYDYDEHDKESKALELDYVEGGYYEFYLTISEQRLRSDYFVKPDYTGDRSVTDAGLHCITVTIYPADKNVIFTTQSFKLYFKIKQAVYDISDIKWDYTDPFVYSGSEHKITIDPTTVPEGLSVTYKTGIHQTNAKLDAGVYTTTVIFHVSDEFAKNYVTPDADDPDTFINNGSFSFSQQWEIKKAEIAVQWNTDNTNSDLFFVPRLVTGDAFVNYAYERYDGTGFVACTSITSTGNAERYRVTASVKDSYKNNYVLTGDTTCEFEVAASQFAVTFYVEINGEKSESGAKFAYTGNAFEAAPKVVDGSVTISNFTVNYYNVNASGNRGTQLSAAPVNVGTYRAVITTEFKVSGNTFSSETEFDFEVEKADLDLSGLGWSYSKNGTTLTAYYDPDQQKFIGADGKEAVFAFEYDGSQQNIQLIGAETVTGLEVTGVSGATGANAADYVAYITWTYDEDNYNEPEFPKTFKWTITQARINFDAVKWGYIDADGVEHEFGKDGASFTVTRDEEGKAVNATVALINLPDYVKSLFKYLTTSYTDNDFGEQNSNSFWAAGEYKTEVYVSGVYNDPTGNRQSFTSDDFPPNVVKILDWEIKDRELTAPKYDGSWEVFDNKVHNISDLCGVPEAELKYFDIEIVFMNHNNDIDNNYAGYKGVTGDLFEAGFYTIRFNKLDGANGENSYIFGSVELAVKKFELEVLWNHDGTIPVAMVKGIYVSDKLETKYYIVIQREGEDGVVKAVRGAEVDINYIKSVERGDFEAQPAITEAYENDITYKMANGEVEVYPFTYEPFIPDKDTVTIDKPTIPVNEIEYTGSAITFELVGFNSTYLYILEGEEILTQKEVDTYRVTIAFRAKDPEDKTNKIGNAYWRGSSSDDPDRSTIVLEFKITPPTKYPLAYPTLSAEKADYTGSAIEVSVPNWIAYQDYVEYEVFFNNDVSLGENIPLSFTDIGVYKITFKIREGSIGVWKDDPDNPKKNYDLYFRIVDPDAEDDMIPKPEIEGSVKEYTGEALEFVINKNWDSEILQVTDYPEGVTVDGNILKVTDIGRYTVTVTIIVDGVTFFDGSTTCRLSITVSTNPNVTAPLTKPSLEKATAVYTGEKIEFKIDGWESVGYSTYLEISLVTCDKGEVPIEVSGGTIKATAAGTYTVTVSFIEGANAMWKDTGDKEPYTLVFTITGNGGGSVSDNIISTPTFEKPSLEWTGKDIQFVINNWSELSKYVDYEVFDAAGNSLGQNLAPKAVGKYTVVLTIKQDYPDMTFEDGSREIRLSFEIKKATLSLKVDEEGKPVIKDNKPVYVNGDGEEVDIGDYFEPIYRDPDTGEIVPPDKLEEGKDYDVSFEIKDDKKEEFNSNVNNSEDVTNEMNKTYRITYVKTESGGFPTIWIIVIVVAAVVLVALVIGILVLALRRRNDGGDYDDGYEDEYDDEDYDEDYDDEYDDEDYDEDYDDDYGDDFDDDEDY